MKHFEVIAFFKDGRSALYTSRILNDLVRDDSVNCIWDAETGECIHDGENPLVYLEWCATLIAGASRTGSARSAWTRGVVAYVHELCENLSDLIDGDDIHSPRLVRRALLDGAADWTEYSYGGCSLIYNADIARRLCSPSELKKADNGRKAPNARETWLDVQARALYQAARAIGSAAAYGANWFTD